MTINSWRKVFAGFHLAVRLILAFDIALIILVYVGVLNAIASKSLQATLGQGTFVSVFGSIICVVVEYLLMALTRSFAERDAIQIDAICAATLFLIWLIGAFFYTAASFGGFF